MKISYNRQFKRYVVSERGKILHLCLSMGDAERMMGMEPSPEDYAKAIAPTTDDEDFDPSQLTDLFDDLEDALNEAA